MFEKIKNEQRLELCTRSIKELRSLGVGVGVKSPTALGKEELVEQILDVMFGKYDPLIKETRGRPNGTINASENSASNYELDETSCSKLKFASNTVKNSAIKSNIVGLLFESAGQYKVVLNGFNINEEVFELPAEFVKQNNLRVADCVELLLEDNNIVLLGVNGHMPYRGERCCFDDIAITYPSRKINVEEPLTEINTYAPISYGAKVLYYTEDEDINVKLLNAMRNNIDISFYTITFCTSEEKINKLKKLCNNWVVNLADDISVGDKIKEINFLLTRIKRLVEDGKNIMLATDNLVKFFELLQSAGLDDEKTTLLLLNSGAQFKNSASITTIVFVPKMAEKYLNEKEIKQLYTNKIYYENGKIVPSKCHTLFVEKFLTIAEAEFLNKQNRK